MNNTKNHIVKNISIVISFLIVITILLGFAGNSANAGMIQKDDTIGKLIDYSQNKEKWYNFDASKEIGAKVKSGQDAPVNEVGGMCIHPNGHYFYGTTYKVVNIFDINNNTSSNTVKVYSEKNKKGVEYSVSNKNVKPILMLAYLARVAEENKEGVAYTNATAKDAMTRIMWETTYVNQMRKVGLSTYIQPQGYGFTGYNKYINDAAAYADQVQKQGSIETAALEVSMEEAEINKITTTTVNGKTFIGPYRVNLTGGAKVGEITINNSQKAVGIAEKIDTNAIKSVDSVKHHKQFYVVVDGTKTNIESIKIKSKNAITSTKSRIVVVSGGASQNFIIYNGEKTETQVEKTLPTPKTGTLEIQKVDELNDKSIKLEGIEFRVYADKKGWLKKDGEKIEFVKNYDDAEKFKTDKNGKISIKNLPITERYYIYETGLPKELQGIYQLGETNVPGKEGKVQAQLIMLRDSSGKAIRERFSVLAGQTVTVKAVNSRKTTDVYIHKTDADTGKALNGYEFKLYRIDEGKTGWVVAENNVATGTTKDFDKAAKLTTYDNGKTAVLKSLPAGTYELYETKLGENGEVYSLGTFSKDGQDGLVGKLIDTQKVAAKTTGEFVFEETNKQEFIKITGKVFEDIYKVVKNEPERDGVYTSEDKLLKGIEVILRDLKTKEERKTYTDENGEYSFDNVRIRQSDKSETADYLKYYVVQFNYDGFIYQTALKSEKEVVKYNADGKTINETTSKAFESEYSRNKLNELFKNGLTGEGQKLSNGVELKYNKAQSGLATLENTSKLVDTEKGRTVEGKSDFIVKSVTTSNILVDYYNTLSNQGKSIVTEIPHIDLGLFQRNMTDLTLSKYIHNAEIKVNGQKYTYRYNGAAKDPKDTTLGVQFDSKYSLPLYKADVEYQNKEDTNKELHATVTYRVQLTNYAGDLYSTVNGLDEWYSKNYTLAKENGEYAIYVSDSDDETKFNENNRVKGVKIDTNESDSTYKNSRITFTNPIKVPARKSENESNRKYVYIKFDINNIKDIYNNDSNLENYAEINSYTVYQDAEYTQPYAAIDNTSIPRNLNPKNFEKTDEDDSDKARGLKLVEAAERVISGTVFEDTDRDGVVGANQERIGNGIFDEGEKTIAGVKVQLVDENGKPAKIYNKNSTAENKMEDAPSITTDEHGNFKITGLVAGTYKLVYTWGEENGYKVEDYKGTIYVNKERANNVHWVNDEDPRYSDAMDDYKLRTAIDQKALFNKDTEGYSDLSKMISTTPKFAIGIEKQEYEETPGETGFTFNINNIDFGIIERPRQAMEINKNLTAIKLTTNDGTQVVNAAIKDGKLNVITGEKWVTGGEDYIWVQIDKSITTGMKAEMGYNITVGNVSETDYDSEEYYKYGEKNGTPITMTLKAEAIYDYCKGTALLADGSTEWETVKPGDYLTTEGEPITTMTEANFKEQYNKAFNEDGEQVEEFSWENSYKEMTEIYTDWIEQMAVLKKTDVRSVRLDNRDILKYNGTKLTRALAPGESETAEIKTSKLISNGDNIRFDNDAEITNITYTTSQRTGRKPSAMTSKTYTRAGWTSITPATGENRDYTWIIITAVSAIAVLGAGIIIIKKKVLK